MNRQFAVSTVIDEYDDQAFAHCRHLLYPYLHLKHVQEHQIGRKELKEYVFDLLRIPGASTSCPFRMFGKIARQMGMGYFRRVKCNAGYLERFEKLLASIEKENPGMEDAEDFMKLYISYLRCWNPSFDLRNNSVSEFTFAVAEEDEAVFRNFIRVKIKYPVEKKQMLGLIKHTEYRVLPYKTRRYMYTLMALMYCRILQYEGD